MLMDDKNIFDRFYSAQTKEIMAHCILRLRHVFIRVKAFILMLVAAKFIYSLSRALRGVQKLAVN